MKFLLDMNVPRSLGQRLENVGHKSRHVGDVGMFQANDSEIINVAQANNEAIITHDLDFGDLLAFSGASSPSIIILRLRNTEPTNLFEKILTSWPEIEQPLQKGALVIINDQKVRIRELPI